MCLMLLVDDARGVLEDDLDIVMGADTNDVSAGRIDFLAHG